MKTTIEYPGKVNEMAKAWDQWAEVNYLYSLDGRSWNEKIEANQ